MMKKIGSFFFALFTVILLSGCNTIVNNNNSKIVSDDETISILKGNVELLNMIPKTVELYVKGAATNDDYTKEDKILGGLESRYVSSGTGTLTPEKIYELKLAGIINVTTAISVTDVEKNITDVFGPVSLTHQNIGTCPKFIYYEKDKSYYVNSVCQNTNASSVVSYVDKVTNNENIYYVTVYAGLLENNVVYADFNKKTTIKTLAPEELYEISEESKEQFTKIVYTFTKDSNGNYVFKEFKLS